MLKYILIYLRTIKLNNLKTHSIPFHQGWLGLNNTQNYYSVLPGLCPRKSKMDINGGSSLPSAQLWAITVLHTLVSRFFLRLLSQTCIPTHFTFTAFLAQKALSGIIKSFNVPGVLFPSLRNAISCHFFNLNSYQCFCFGIQLSLRSSCRYISNAQDFKKLTHYCPTADGQGQTTTPTCVLSVVYFET